MRNAVIETIECLAENDPRIMVVTADLGYGVLEQFAKKYPSRFFNVGISEQFMASAAAGMALLGNIVVTYSIGNFATLRGIEQIRNDICYHNANVKIIAVGGGFAYGQLGMSHHATEDIAMMRALPNMRVFVPADPEEAVTVANYALTVDGPCYIRLARRGEPILYTKGLCLDIEKIHAVSEGTDVALLACGPLLNEAIRAATQLEENHISTGVFSIPCVKPLDTEAIANIAHKYKVIVSVEEHQIIGGLGGAIAEVLSSIKGSRAYLHRLGLQDEYTSIVGGYEHLCDHYGLCSSAIAKTVSSLLSTCGNSMQ